MKVWTWLERTAPPTGAWPTSRQSRAGERAHYIEDSWPGSILVEFIDGEREIWPLAECRVLGVDSVTAPNSLENRAVTVTPVVS